MKLNKTWTLAAWRLSQRTTKVMTWTKAAFSFYNTPTEDVYTSYTTEDGAYGQNGANNNTLRLALGNTNPRMCYGF
ncbi:hypothetical protein G6F68_001487 [Rhizopus microsporus]|nr:hypothetical protein G6F67_002288 [Rhizopus microsporus]KAG1267990.1 hypothetical protein G6F68_001487 [Rhizopus microsporus]